MPRRRIYIYKESHLPSEGWLQGCFGCLCITGDCQVFTHQDNQEYVVYLCGRCVDLIKEDEKLRELYDRKVREYIATHF